MNWNNRKRREQRFRAFNKGRRLSKLTLVTGDKTYSVAGSDRLSANTVSESVMEEAEIMKFQAVVNDCNGIVEIDENHNSCASDSVDFEKLCHQKRSEYSDNCAVLSNELQLTEHLGSPGNQTGSTATAYSMGSFDADTPGTRQSSHCARVCWNQHSIPQLTSYSVGPRRLSPVSLKADTGNKSSSSEQSTFIASVKGRFTSTYDAWSNIPRLVQYYLLCITFGFVAMLYAKLP